MPLKDQLPDCKCHLRKEREKTTEAFFRLLSQFLPIQKRELIAFYDHTIAFLAVCLSLATVVVVVAWRELF